MSPEFDIIRKFFARGRPPSARVTLGIGDDCALIDPSPGHEIALSTDTLVEGVHFFPHADPQSLGHKALAVNLSDLAAMGAIPRAVLLALTLPSVDDSWLASFARGFFDLADLHGVELVGGDTTRGPLAMTLTVVGEVEKGRSLLRGSAIPGDDVWVSGELGAAALAVGYRSGTFGVNRAWRTHVDARLDRPQPRVQLGRALLGMAHAAIDVSDGIVADLGHICERSKVAARLEWESIPQAAALRECPEAIREACVLGGGDDYELVFTAPASQREAISALGAIVPVARIGVIHEGETGVEVVDRQGRRVGAGIRGYDHFTAPASHEAG